MLEIRKLQVSIEETRAELGRPVDPPLTTAVVSVVVRNPWAGPDFVDDLRPVIRKEGAGLGELLSGKLIEALGSAEAVEAYGKAAIVGLDGELEHASALVHTLHFGLAFRGRLAGESYLVFTNTRSPAGCLVTVPMVHKHDAATRSHYLTAQTTIADAPRGDEILVAVAGATRGRPFHRIGDRDIDLAEIEAETQA